jgi:hypothetical protein
VVRGVKAAENIRIDVVICTSGEHHLLAELGQLNPFWSQNGTNADPPFLGYECHALLRERLGKYDFYGYMEDDLIIDDPWFFRKILWFNREFGDSCVLQPNRFETGQHPTVDKIYVDGNLPAHCVSESLNQLTAPVLFKEFLGLPIHFRAGTNPHAGCFFLTESQMRNWAVKPYFLDRSSAFIGALESAATLGLMRTFSVYKPGLENADFLEIQHFGQAYLSMISRDIRLELS